MAPYPELRSSDRGLESSTSEKGKRVELIFLFCLLWLHRHLNCGAGRIVWQDIVKIDQCVSRSRHKLQRGSNHWVSAKAFFLFFFPFLALAIRTKEFYKTENILKSFNHAKETTGRLHLLGLVRSISHASPQSFRLYAAAKIPSWLHPLSNRRFPMEESTPISSTSRLSLLPPSRSASPRSSSTSSETDETPPLVRLLAT